MRRHERRQWAAARTLDDLGELTARWLEGDLASHPGYGDDEDSGPDPETADIGPVLAGLNRAGYVTESSQPGIPAEPGCPWQQRAAVQGFADDHTLAAIEEAVSGTDLILIANRTPRRSPLNSRFTSWMASDDGAVPVTATVDGRTHTWFGVLLGKPDVTLSFSAASGQARRAVLNAWQVTVIDPEWGRNDLLWDTLTSRFLAGAR